jgi:hypothetical protein
MAASTSSGFHTYQSWGRTRRPKSITGGDSTTVTDCADLTAAAAGTGVCITENQRFLHIATAAGASLVNVWAYSHAFGVWSELKIGGATVTAGASEHKIVEISGIDKVAFNITGVVYAACSTF